MYTENVFISPSWWDTLSQQEKKHLKGLIEYLEDNNEKVILNIEDHPQAIDYLTHKFL